MAGAILATRWDVAGAERMFRQALAVAERAHGPRSVRTASALENLADLLAQTGRESAARPLLERAARMRSRSGNAQRLLGDCYAELNLPEKAIGAYQKAVKVNPGAIPWRFRPWGGFSMNKVKTRRSP